MKTLSAESFPKTDGHHSPQPDRSNRRDVALDTEGDVPDQTKPGFGWVQKPWWFLQALVRALSPARFSLFVALLGGSIFLFVQQGTEILRCLAERDQDTNRLNHAHILWFFGALALWSLQGWYWARTLLSFHFPSRPSPPAGWQGGVIRWCQRHGPGILGVLPPLLIAVACFFPAQQCYDDQAPGNPKAVLRFFGLLAVAMALILCWGVFLPWRRRLPRGPAPDRSPTTSFPAGVDPAAVVGFAADAPSRSYRHLSEFRTDRRAWYPALGFAVFSLGLLTAFLLVPVHGGLAIGSGALLCLAASAWVCFGSLVVWLSERMRLPLIGLLVAWVVLCSFWNDNHLVCTVAEAANPDPQASDPEPPPAGKSLPLGGPVARAFVAWQATLPKAQFERPPGAPKPLRPVYLVATEGGGIRAAYWTALVLSFLQDQSKENAKDWQLAHPGQEAPPDFASHLFAVSGVSGGSLGAAVFDALLAENVSHPLAEKAGYMLRQDFLSPTLAALLFPDLLQRFCPVPIPAADRARALEKGWEHGWALTISGKRSTNRLAEPLRSLWKRTGTPTSGETRRLPALFLNGTSVETGQRIIVSNLKITSGERGEFADALDLRANLRRPGSTPDPDAVDLPLSTAAHLSARFTYVSPAGRLPAGGHVVDGGYFENSGATTALEILYVVESVIAQHAEEWPERLVPVVIEIRNGPVDGSDATLVQQGTTGPAASSPGSVPRRRLLGEVLDPLDTLLNAREARGSFSQAAIEGEQGAMPDAPPWPALYRFGLYQSKVPLPLGWMLSGGAADEMNRQLRDEQLGNYRTLRDITRLLLPPS